MYCMHYVVSYTSRWCSDVNMSVIFQKKMQTFEFTGGLSGLNLYKQYIAVIIKREVNALSLPQKLSNRSYQTCTRRCLSFMRRKVADFPGYQTCTALSELHAKKVVVGVVPLKLFSLRRI